MWAFPDGGSTLWLILLSWSPWSLPLKSRWCTRGVARKDLLQGIRQADGLVFGSAMVLETGIRDRAFSVFMAHFSKKALKCFAMNRTALEYGIAPAHPRIFDGQRPDHSSSVSR